MMMMMHRNMPANPEIVGLIEYSYTCIVFGVAIIIILY